MTDSQPVIAVDTRSPEAYRAGHSPGTVNIPHRAIAKGTIAHLDQDALHVCDCDGIGCNASTKGALSMARLGFRTQELIGGLDWWRRDGYPIQTEETATKPACGC
jgi:rhodanese-related sulfurtransferase